MPPYHDATPRYVVLYAEEDERCSSRHAMLPRRLPDDIRQPEGQHKTWKEAMRARCPRVDIAMLPATCLPQRHFRHIARPLLLLMRVAATRYRAASRIIVTRACAQDMREAERYC